MTNYEKLYFLILTLIASFSFTSIAFSQTADEEELVVTGSRIIRPEISSNAPVSVIRREDILKSGYTKYWRPVNKLTFNNRYCLKYLQGE